MAEEGLKKTENDLIYIGSPIPFDTDEFLSNLDDVMNAAYSNKKDIRAKVAGMVTTYHPADNTEQGSEESNRVLVDEEKDLE